MLTARFIPVAMLLAAQAAWAQLAPSTFQPQRPPATTVPGTPVRPLTPPTSVPVTPVTPVAPAATEEAPADLSNGIPNTLTPEEQAQGWKLLFDGTRLIGMKGVQRSDPLTAGWKIAAGELNLPKDIDHMDRITGGDLITLESFVDFEFRFDWKATVSANSGVRYLVQQSIGQSPAGLEYQIIDDVHSPLGLKGGPLRRSAALDNVLPAGPNARLRTADPLAHKGDPWNEGRIVIQGNTAQHWLNGEKVLEFTLGSHLRTTAEKNWDRNDKIARPGGMFGTKVKTPIVLLDEGTEVAFRNLKIRPLTAGIARPAPPAPAPATTGTNGGGKVPNPFLLPPKR